jgi:predicted nucleic-acid-binding protein
MIAVDTNVLVRLLTGDDPAQTRLAADLFAQESIFIPKTVLLETEWVLRYRYELAPTVILTAFRKVLGLPQVAVEDSNALVEALARYGEGMDFADALHLASVGEADQFATFDVRLKKRAGTQVKVRLL